MSEILWGPGTSFDAAWWRGVYALYETAWPAITERLQRADQLGWPWAPTTTPFVYQVEGVPVAHVGVLAHPVHWNGEDRVVGGIHAVCTHPAHRGRGYCRALMEAATAHIDQHFDASKLHTDYPDLYARFGYEVMPTHTFSSQRSGGGGRARLLDLSDAASIRGLHELLAQHQPISARFSSTDPGWLVGIDAALSRKLDHWFHRVDGAPWVGVYEHLEDTLLLHDVRGSTLPTLKELLGSVAQPFSRVVYGFSPDKLDPSAEATPVPLEVGVVQVRGRWSQAGPIGISAAWEH